MATAEEHGDGRSEAAAMAATQSPGRRREKLGLETKSERGPSEWERWAVRRHRAAMGQALVGCPMGLGYWAGPNKVQGVF